MIRKVFLIIGLLSSTSAFAQQQAPTAIDRIANSLGQCVSKAEAFVDQIASLNAELAQAKAKIKELEEKGK